MEDREPDVDQQLVGAITKVLSNMSPDSKMQLKSKLQSCDPARSNIGLVPRRKLLSRKNGPVVVRLHDDTSSERGTLESVKNGGTMIYMNFGLGDRAGVPESLFQKLIDLEYKQRKNSATSTVKGLIVEKAGEVVRYVFEQLVDLQGLTSLNDLLVDCKKGIQNIGDLPRTNDAASRLAQYWHRLPALENVWSAVAAMETPLIPRQKRLISFLKHNQQVRFARALDELAEDLQTKCPTHDQQTLEVYFGENIDAAPWLKEVVGERGADSMHLAKECLRQQLRQERIDDEQVKRLFKHGLAASRTVDDFVRIFGCGGLAIVHNSFDYWSSKDIGRGRLQAAWPVVKEHLPDLDQFTKLLEEKVVKPILAKQEISQPEIDDVPGEKTIQERVVWPDAHS